MSADFVLHVNERRLLQFLHAAHTLTYVQYMYGEGRGTYMYIIYRHTVMGETSFYGAVHCIYNRGCAFRSLPLSVNESKQKNTEAAAIFRGKNMQKCTAGNGGK